jgi:hypothetical protein
MEDATERPLNAEEATRSALEEVVPAYLEFAAALAGEVPAEDFDDFRQSAHELGSNLLGLSLRAMRQLEAAPDPTFHRLVDLLRDITESLLAAGAMPDAGKMQALPLVPAEKVSAEAQSLGLPIE